MSEITLSSQTASIHLPTLVSTMFGQVIKEGYDRPVLWDRIMVRQQVGLGNQYKFIKLPNVTVATSSESTAFTTTSFSTSSVTVEAVHKGCLFEQTALSETASP